MFRKVVWPELSSQISFEFELGFDVGHDQIPDLRLSNILRRCFAARDPLEEVGIRQIKEFFVLRQKSSVQGFQVLVDE